MHWIIDNKFDHDPKILELINNLIRLNISYSRVKTRSFDMEYIEFENSNESIEMFNDKKVFSYGSYTLANICAKLFNPGAYISPNISIETLLQNYNKNMLNSDTIIDTIQNINPTMDSFFLRPNEDTKSIIAELVTKDNFNKWKTNILKLNLQEDTYCTLHSDTKICISSPKKIDAEYRCFIACKKVIAASQYKRGNTPYFNNNVDSYIIDYTNDIISTWTPDDAFVIDIALMANKLYVIECNCINSSGFYDIDTQKLIMAIENNL